MCDCCYALLTKTSSLNKNHHCHRIETPSSTHLLHRLLVQTGDDKQSEMRLVIHLHCHATFTATDCNEADNSLHSFTRSRTIPKGSCYVWFEICMIALLPCKAAGGQSHKFSFAQTQTDNHNLLACSKASRAQVSSSPTQASILCQHVEILHRSDG